MQNIGGLFQFEIDGVARDMRCNFGVLEKCERNIHKRPMVQVITELANFHFIITEMVDVFLVALQANGDTRLNREQIYEGIRKDVTHAVTIYTKMLSYMIFGTEDAPKQDGVFTEDDKKK